MASESSVNNGLDEVKLKRLKYNILQLERENLRTRELSDDEIIDKIRKMIEGEVRKCY